MRDALANAAIRRILAAAAVSQIGDWAARLAIAFVVLDKTGLASGVGVAGALFFLPWLGPGQLLAGFGDRMDRVRLLVACELSRALLYGLIALGAGAMPVWLLLAAVAVVAVIDPVWEANRAALIVDVTTEEEYPSAIKIVTSVNQASTLIGWAAGGFLVAWVGTGAALGVNAATFVVSALFIGAISAHSQSERVRKAGSFGAAREFLARDVLSRIAVMTTIGLTIAAMAIETQAPVYARAIGLPDRWIGVLIAMVPAVTVVAVLLLPTTRTDGPLLVFGFSMAGLAAVVAAASFIGSSTRGLPFLGYGAIGAMFASSTLANIVVGRRLPSANRAAVFSVIQGAVFLSLSAGALVGGPLSDLAGARPANVIFAFAGAVVCFGGAVVAAGVGRPRSVVAP